MADPFEVRFRFTNLLSHLSASSTASQKTASYALKHRDMDEDLHSCILENLERNNMNNRANIMYFLEHFVEMAKRDEHQNYVEMVRRDIGRIVEAVAPAKGPGGGANIKVVRRVVGSLGDKGFLEKEVVRSIEESLKEREGDTGRLQPGRGHLVHQGLELMVIMPVDQKYGVSGVFKLPGYRQAGKTRSQDNDALPACCFHLYKF